MYLSAPFNLQNFYKKILELIQTNEDVRHFCDQNSEFALNKIYFHLPLAFFILQNLKEFLQWIQNYEEAPFLGPKWSICL